MDTIISRIKMELSTQITISNIHLMDKVEYDDVNIFGNLDDYAYDHADDVYVAEIFSIIHRLYRAPDFTNEQCDNFCRSGHEYRLLEKYWGNSGPMCTYNITIQMCVIDFAKEVGFSVLERINTDIIALKKHMVISNSSLPPDLNDLIISYVF